MNLTASINKFSKISLEEMNSVKLMDRVESKFLLSIDDLPRIFNEVENDYRIVNINDNLIPEYKTVYFDTDDMLFYNEHHRKRNERYKVRFRNYVNSNITFFEVKHKKNGRVNKKRIQVANEEFKLNDENREFLEESKLDKLNLDRKLTNHYSRITLVSNHTIERVTFDINVRFNHGENSSSLDNLVIVELKQAELSRLSPIYLALRKANIKPFKLSKYCVGLIKTYGLDVIKYNRFKKKLLKIEKITSI